MSAAYDIAFLLDKNDHGELWASTGWALHVASEPNTPNTCITCYDTGGREPHYGESWEQPSVQVRVRGDPGSGYPTAMDKIQSIKEFLVYNGALTHADVSDEYLCWLEGDVAWLEFDQNERPIFVCNFRTIRSESTNG